MIIRSIRPISFAPRILLSCRRFESRGSTSFKERKPYDPEDSFASKQENRDVVLGGFGYSKVESLDAEQKCLFPLLESLNAITKDRMHQFNTTPDFVIRNIKLGIINKYLGLQYCHYLAHLARTCDSKPDSEFYAWKCLDLVGFFERKSPDLVEASQTELYIDAASASAKNCEAVCKNFIQMHQGKIDKGSGYQFPTEILISVYKFGLWDLGNQLLSAGILNQKVVNIRICDHLVQALARSAYLYKSGTLDDGQKEKLQDDIWNHLIDLFDICTKNRIQFITKQKLEFTQALDDLGFVVAKNLTIKNSGRCTACNHIVPLYDKSSTATLNEAIKELLIRGKSNGLYLNTDPEEVARYQEFMYNLRRLDPKPIDCVIDGLNVAYHCSDTVFQTIRKGDQEVTIRKNITSSMTQVLVNTMIRSGILRNFRKILVIGQDHMIRWPGLLDFLTKNKIHYFFSKNTSKDDLFQLYAATLHPSTIIVTNDMFRDFISLLDSEKKLMLIRWIDTHQSFVMKRKLTAIMPTPYETIPSSDKINRTCFHVPVIDFHRLEDMNKHKPPPHLNDEMTMWICCTRKRNIAQ